MEIKARIITNKGDINLILFPEIAPYTVANFVALTLSGYYTNMKFHRVIKDFMIQTGDPTGTGMGGPGYQFMDEKIEMEFDRPGILAMANAGPNTNGSQFFITHIPTMWLNYKHTIFGEVVSEKDQEVVDSIEQGDDLQKIELYGDVEQYLEQYKYAVDEFKNAIVSTK